MNKLLIIAFAGGVAACSSSGMGSAVRADITARMQAAQAPITACYAKALESNRKAKGMMILAFTAAPTTGQFVDISVTRDEVNDPTVKSCVVEEVGKLKLEKPQSTKVAIPSYPIRFAPTK